MANSSLDLTSLDFDTLKEGFKQYLKANSTFKDYNFEGSNINVLMDVMSYNTYLNSFYLNMVSSEMFLDSAQKLDSVVSHAKELNYIPKSAKSSSASISFTIDTQGSIYQTFTVPKDAMFSGTNANGTFTFTTKEAHTYLSTTDQYTVANLSIYEGAYVNDSYVFDSSAGFQRFILTNPTIDLDSISVVVSENNGLNIHEYAKADTLFNLTKDSTVYFVQAAQNSQYEIAFGDGVLGRVPQNGAVISVSYRITTGTAADGINNFICTQDLGIVNGGVAKLSTISVSAMSSGGAAAEGIESIRKSAPRYFATQQRAVSSDDYSSLIFNEFGGLVNDVNVYGGETQEPKLYGRVVIAVKPADGLVAPNYVKNNIQTYLASRTGLPTRVKIVDPDYLFCSITSTVQYNKNSTSQTANEIKSAILASIKKYSTDNLEKFGNDFRYSKFVAYIDNSDTSITSNDTHVAIIKRISPKLYYSTPYSLKFSNMSEMEHSSPGYVRIPPNAKPFFDEPVLTSSAFTYVDDIGFEFPYSYFRDDNFGKLVIYTVVNGAFTILNANAGAIDYTTGTVSINAFKTSYYDTYIKIYMVPNNKDIIATQDKIIVIESTDVAISVIETVK